MTFYEWLMKKYPNVTYEASVPAYEELRNPYHTGKNIKIYTQETLASDLKYSHEEFGNINLRLKSKLVYKHNGTYHSSELDEIIPQVLFDADNTLRNYFDFFIKNYASNECMEIFVKSWNEYRQEVKE